MHEGEAHCKIRAKRAKQANNLNDVKFYKYSERLLKSQR